MASPILTPRVLGEIALLAHCRAMPRQQHPPSYIRAWRQHRDVSLEALADAIGTSGASLSRIETGKQPYSQPILEALARELRCHPACLISSDPSRCPNLWDIIRKATPSQLDQIARVAAALVETPTIKN